MKLIVDELESTALSAAIKSDPRRRLVASWSLHTELLCAAARAPRAVKKASVEKLLEYVVLCDLIRGDLLNAAGNASLCTNDAIHLAVATRIGVDEIFTYDAELAEAADRAGITVLSPGVS